MSGTSGGRILVDALVAHGVDTVFGIPGTHNLAVFAALAERGVDVVLPRHEQGGGYGADGYARLSGRPGVCITTSGPGILNAAAAAAQAWSDSVPVLFVSPGPALDHLPHGNGQLHEVRNQQAAMHAVCAYSHRVRALDEIPAAVADAFTAMTAGRPRPVHLEIPLDLMDATSEVAPVEPIAAQRILPARDVLAEAARRLGSAASPVVIAGGGARGAAAEVVAAAELFGAPVVTTTNGKGVIDELHPLSVGAGLHQPSVRALLEDADCVLAVGTELAPSDLWNGPIALAGKLIRIDIDARAMTTNAEVTVPLLGDAAGTLTALVDAATEAGSQPAGTAATPRAEAARAALIADGHAEGRRYLPIVEALAPLVDERTVLAGDSTMACYYGMLTNLRLRHPGAFLYPTGGGTLGYGLPAAIGASLADPGARVIAMLGDGGVMFTLPELATAAQRGLPLPVIIVDNGGYGEIRNEMTDRGEPATAVELGGVDFAAVATGLGCHGETIADVADLTDAVRRAWDADRPTVLHVREPA